MQFFTIVVPLILILAAFIVSTVLTGKGKKVFQNGPKDKASYRTLLGSTVSIALIVAVGILIFTQIISLIINEATLSTGSISHAIQMIVDNHISFEEALNHGLLDGLLSFIQTISALSSLLIAGVCFLVAGKTGKKPFIIVALAFFALYLLDDATQLLRSFVSGVNYAARVGITFDNFYDGYVFIRLVFSLIGGVLAVIAAITAALSIKSVVKTGVAVVKGVTVAFTIVATLGVPVLINLLYNLFSTFDALLNSTPSLASSPFDYVNLVITALSSLSLLLPIIALLRAGGDIPQEALNAVEEAPKKVEAPIESVKPTTSAEAVSKSAPVVVKPVENKTQSVKLSATSSSSEPIWREKKNASGKPIDGSGKEIEQFATNRGIVKFFFLSLITFSIYGLVIMCKVTGELRKVREGHGKDKPLPFFVMIILTPLTLGIVPLVWNHKMAKRLQEECEYRDIASPIKPWQFWVFAILLSELLFFPFYYQAKFFIASNLINAHHNKYGDKKIRVVTKPAPKAVEETKPVENVVAEPVEKAPTPAVEEKPVIVEAKPVEEPTPTPVEEKSAEAPKVDPMEKLKKAKAMLDAGLITQAEYDEIKTKALADL